MNKKIKIILVAAVLLGGGYFAWKKFGKKDERAAYLKSLPNDRELLLQQYLYETGRSDVDKQSSYYKSLGLENLSIEELKEQLAQNKRL
jgi:hypothetical protein